ncbi:MAG: T9SS type A sorting domain-containing protein, partial [Candidatus Poribacteria bacterium]|nr:T9SS type A sorting domain-containing protein [Candidatus Poribacteria bacterium]
HWLAQAQTLDLTDTTTQMGVLMLEQLVAVLTPEESALLPNYPNPFNPETWIPYQLSRDAEVTLTIYDANGFTVRRLDLGHQLVGYYSERGKAVHWDGRNDLGESVASGVYFYHLNAGDFSATRKMLILK